MMATQYDDSGRDGFYSEYDAQRAALARRRRIAQLLQEQAMHTRQGPAAGRMSILEPLAQMAQAWAGKSIAGEADAELRANAAKEQEAMQQGISNFPQDQPATPMIPATEGLGPTGVQPPTGSPEAGSVGMPMIPRSPNDLLDYAGRMSKFGGMGARVGEHAANLGLERMFPKSTAAKLIPLANGDLYDVESKSFLQGPGSVEARSEKERSARAAEAEKERQAEYRDAEAVARREQQDRQFQQGQETKNLMLGLAAGSKADRDAERRATATERVVEKAATEYGKSLTKEKVPQLDLLLSNAEQMLGKYAGAQDIPGIGGIKNVLPGALLSEEGAANQQTITGLRRLITTSEAGLSQTASEMKGVLQNLGLTGLSTTAQFKQAIPILRTVLEKRKATLRGSYRPEAVQLFDERSASGAESSPEAAVWGTARVRTP